MADETEKYWYETIVTEAEEQLNDWERSFMDSIRLKVENGWKLTPLQRDKLEQIYNRVTS